MRALSVAMAVVLGVVFAEGCGKPKVVDKDKLVERGGLMYEVDSDMPFMGTAVEYHSSGQKKTEVEYRDGKPHGKATGWHKNGQKAGAGKFRDGKWHGKVTAWHENGQKMTEAEFRDNKLIKSKCWDWNGKPKPCPEWDEEKQRFKLDQW